MGANGPAEQERDQRVLDAIEFIRMNALLKRLDGSADDKVDEWFFELGDEWDVRLSTTQASGQAVCYRLVVEPRGTSARGWTASLAMPSGGITSSLLRKIPLRALLEEWDEVRVSEGRAVTPLAGAEGRRRGPARVSEDWIRVVAAAYVLGCLSAPQAPLEAAVKLLGPGYSYSTTREHVQRARDEGFLAPTKKGLARLELGPRWKDVMSVVLAYVRGSVEEDGEHEAVAGRLEAVFEGVLSATDQHAANALLREFAAAIRR